MPNYGDAALNLPPDWTRTKFESEQVQYTVGHKEGVAEVRLTKNPEEEHQFFWCDLNHPTDKDVLRDQGFTFVNKDEWTAERWEWNSEGKLRSLLGLLMARPKAVYLAEEDRKRAKREREMVNRAEAEALSLAEQHGIEVTDGDGKRLVRARRNR